jgi:hypothetical protein
MIRDAQYFENRIALLSGRDRDNSNIIKKLQRQLRKAKAKNK